MSREHPEVVVICTNRDRHSKVILDLLTDLRPGGFIQSSQAHHPGQQIRDVPAFSFACRRCGRNPWMSGENLGTALTRLYAAFPSDDKCYQLDVSYGP